MDQKVKPDNSNSGISRSGSGFRPSNNNIAKL
jgi:hypothetical protein